MLFNSLEFIVFLPIVFFTYWIILKGRITLQNIFIILSSYLFYGWWDWRFLFLIILSSIIDYSIGIILGNTNNLTKRKILLSVSLLVNLGLLGFFKYFNFFLDSFVGAFASIGVHLDPISLSIVLPVGISFYTFQTLSYTIDVYRGDVKPNRSVLAFFAYVSFFPQLVAGPIERASQLLPQFSKAREFSFEKAVDGIKQMLWGFFKKIVIADTCATYVNIIFDDHGSVSAGMLILGSIYFAFQIYGDFSGYSDIAIGCARLFGFDLMTNFKYPYFSRDIAEFWRRWHISLSTWFRDYLYIPLGGSRVNLVKKIRNVCIIFLVSGFWHGANWTFIFWGALNALYFIPLMLRGANRKYLETISPGRIIPSISEFLAILKTFLLTCIAWIFFRAESMGQAFSYLEAIITFQSGSFDMMYLDVLPLISLLVLIEWVQRDKTFPLQFQKMHKWLRYVVYILLLYLTIIYAKHDTSEFIYFQF